MALTNACTFQIIKRYIEGPVKMLFKTILFLLFNLVIFCHGGKQFRLGRSKGGNLGGPGNYAGEKLPPAQWFKQKIDHFTATDVRYWKQVLF